MQRALGLRLVMIRYLSNMYTMSICKTSINVAGIFVIPRKYYLRLFLKEMMAERGRKVTTRQPSLSASVCT